MSSRLLRASILAVMCTAACSSTGTGIGSDSGSCEGTTCGGGGNDGAHDAQVGPEAATAADGAATDGWSQDGPSDGAGTAINQWPLCTNGRFHVGMPLPSGIALLHDYSSVITSFTPTLVANDTAAFLDDVNSIHRLNLADGSDTTLVTALSTDIAGGVHGIAIDNTNLYFTESGTTSRGVVKVPLDGSAGPTTLLAGYNVGPLAVSNGYVYFYFEWPSPSGPPMPTIARIPTTGGAATTLVNLPGFVNSLIVQGSYVYFAVPSGSNVAIVRIPVTAQAPSLDGASNDAGAAPDAGDAGGNAGIPAGAQLVATTTGVQRLVSDGTNLFWGNGDQLMTVPLTGGSPTKIGSAPPKTGPFTTTSSINMIAAATGFAYWSYVPACSNIFKTSTDGTQQTKLVDYAWLYALAVNSTKLFFIAGDGQLLSMAR